MQTTKDRLEEWQTRCPLRQWRVKQKFGLHNAASMLAISVSSLQTLEAGTSMPTTAMLRRLANGMGQKPGALEASWEAWLATKPKGKRA